MIVVRNFIKIIFLAILTISCSQLEDEHYVENCADDKFINSLDNFKTSFFSDWSYNIDNLNHFEESIEKTKNEEFIFSCNQKIFNPKLLSEYQQESCDNEINSASICTEPFNYFINNNGCNNDELTRCVTKEQKIADQICILERAIRDSKKYIAGLELEIDNLDRLKKDYNSYSLQEKLQTNNKVLFKSYETHFSVCSRSLKEDPILFKAKWK